LAIKKFQEVASGEIRRLQEQKGVNHEQAVSTIVSNLASSSSASASSSKSSSVARSSSKKDHDILFVSEITGFDRELSIRVLLLRQELLQLKRKGMDMPSAIAHLTQRLSTPPEMIESPTTQEDKTQSKVESNNNSNNKSQEEGAVLATPQEKPRKRKLDTTEEPRPTKLSRGLSETEKEDTNQKKAECPNQCSETEKIDASSIESIKKESLSVSDAKEEVQDTQTEVPVPSKGHDGTKELESKGAPKKRKRNEDDTPKEEQTAERSIKLPRLSIQETDTNLEVPSTIAGTPNVEENTLGIDHPGTLATAHTLSPVPVPSPASLLPTLEQTTLPSTSILEIDNTSSNTTTTTTTTTDTTLTNSTGLPNVAQIEESVVSDSVKRKLEKPDENNNDRSKRRTK